MRKFSLIIEGSYFNQLLCVFLISIPMFCYGNTIGWMSPMTLLLQSNNSPKGVPLTDLEISWMASLPYLICVPATYLMATVGDRYGRKFALLLMSGTCVTVWLLKLCSMNICVFIIARSLVGVVMAGSCVTCPTYIKEITEDNIRGALGCWGTLFFTTGSFFAFVIGDLCSYQVVLIVFMIIPASHFVLFLIMPESPSYLIKQGKDDEALKSLMWLRCRNDSDFIIRDEIEFMKREQKNDEKKQNFMIKDILTDDVLRRAFQISLVVVLSRELCGSVLVMNFAGDLLNLTSGQKYYNLSPNKKAMVIGVVQLCGAALTSSIVEKTGRRPLFLVTCMVSGLSMFCLATWFVLQHLNPPAWIPIFTLCLCVVCDASGFMPLSVVIAGEIFSYKYRGTVLAATMSIAAIADFSQLIFFKPIIKSVGVQMIFYIFGAMCTLTAVYVLIMVPETKNRKLEDIYYDLKSKKEKNATAIQNTI